MLQHMRDMALSHTATKTQLTDLKQEHETLKKDYTALKKSYIIEGSYRITFTRLQE